MKWWDWLKERAAALKQETHALYLAYRHPGVPWYAKVWLICVVGYALSPIDLIPDFIPVLGYLDDLVVLPLGIWVAVKLIPRAILAECRAKAAGQFEARGNAHRIATAVIILIWLTVAALLAWTFWRIWN